MKQRFEDARVGDLVYCRINGVGVITARDKFHVTAKFNSGLIWSYNLAGNYHTNSVEPTLFYSDETSNYLEERPKRKVPWNKVPVDTKVLVRFIHGSTLYKRYFSNYINTSSSPYRCFGAGSTSWSCDSDFTLWDYCELAEEITIEGVTYYPGDN